MMRGINFRKLASEICLSTLKQRVIWTECTESDSALCDTLQKHCLYNHYDESWNVVYPLSAFRNVLNQNSSTEDS